MTIERTVGAGGDFAEWRAAWNWLATQDPFTDDYIFTQISTVTIAAGVWDQTNSNTGATISFVCPWADSHQGDPTRGFVTNCPPDIGFLTNVNSTNDLETYIADGLRLVRTAQSAGGHVGILRMGRHQGWSIARNLIIQGWPDTTNGDDGYQGINYERANEHIYNCKIFDCGHRAIGADGGTGGAPPGIKIVENITIHNCFWGVRTINEVEELTVRNVAIVDPMGGSDCWRRLNVGNNWQIINCAASDGSLQVLIDDARATVINPLQNIVAADAFVSLDNTLSGRNFLWLNDSSFNVGGVAVPERGRAPHEVQFTDQTEYDFSDSVLGNTGTAPEIDGHYTDIENLDIPNPEGFYSIGCHQAQII